MRSDDRSREALGDVVENIRLAQEFTAGLDLPGFTADTRTYYATVRCLGIIPEASRRLLPEIRARQAHHPWRQIAAAGNMYRHEHHLIETEMVWKALPPLLAAVEAELAREA